MISKILFVASLAVATALGSGCALFVGAAVGGAAGVGTYAYINGELQSSEAVTLNKAWDASLAAMKDLGYTVAEKQKDSQQAQLTALGPGDKKTQVSLKRKSDTVTQMGIRVGTFGDETLSRQILAKIKSHF